MALNVASESKGRLLFRSIGCLGCHARGEAPSEASRAGGPDLNDLASKRERAWLAGYLVRPKIGIASAHRADLRLSPDESADLAAYLLSGPEPRPIAHTLANGDSARGRALANEYRCAACHEIPGLEPGPAALKLTAASSIKSGCLATGTVAPRVPRFALSDQERGALRTFVSGLPARRR